MKRNNYHAASSSHSWAPGFPIRTRSVPDMPTTHGFHRTQYPCYSCRQAADLRCLDCAPRNNTALSDSNEGRLLCNNCRTDECLQEHTITRVYYDQGHHSNDAGADEHRGREYKSVVKYLKLRRHNDSPKVPSQLVKEKAAKYINGFLNAAGGVILFGVDELDRSLGFLNIEAAIWNRSERDNAKRTVDSIVRKMHPVVPVENVLVCFVPVHSQRGSGGSSSDHQVQRQENAYVLEVHVKQTKHDLNLFSLSKPVCFVEVCVAYQRRGESTHVMDVREKIARLKSRAVPKSIDFSGLILKLIGTPGFIERSSFNQLVSSSLFNGITEGVEGSSVLPPAGLLILGDYGSGKSSWMASRIHSWKKKQDESEKKLLHQQRFNKYHLNDIDSDDNEEKQESSEQKVSPPVQTKTTRKMKTMERKQQRKEHEQESQTEKELAKERKNDNKVQIIIQHLLDEVSSNKGEEEQRSSSFSPVSCI